MTSSLVGSEMCIRDRSMTHLCEEDGRKHYGIARYPLDEWKAQGEPVITVTVSYTHLTLPTICSV
eukprot:8443223-Prorocentrum_lima.AAC.1